MTKHDKIIAGIVTFGLVASLGVAGFIINSPSKEATPASASNSEGKNDLLSNLQYSDLAGFSFSHDSQLKVIDKTPEEGSFYSILSLEKGGSSMTVTMEDTSYTTIGDWLINNSDEKELIGAVSLDGVSARQYFLSSSYLTVAVDSGVLYKIVSPKDEYWRGVHELFIDSFRFDKPSDVTTAPVTTSQTSGNVIYEPEEIIY